MSTKRDRDSLINGFEKEKHLPTTTSSSGGEWKKVTISSRNSISEENKSTSSASRKREASSPISVTENNKRKWKRGGRNRRDSGVGGRSFASGANSVPLGGDLNFSSSFTIGFSGSSNRSTIPLADRNFSSSSLLSGSTNAAYSGNRPIPTFASGANSIPLNSRDGGGGGRHFFPPLIASGSNSIPLGGGDIRVSINNNLIRGSTPNKKHNRKRGGKKSKRKSSNRDRKESGTARNRRGGEEEGLRSEKRMRTRQDDKKDLESAEIEQLPVLSLKSCVVVPSDRLDLDKYTVGGNRRRRNKKKKPESRKEKISSSKKRRKRKRSPSSSSNKNNNLHNLHPIAEIRLSSDLYRKGNDLQKEVESMCGRKFDSDYLSDLIKNSGPTRFKLCWNNNSTTTTTSVDVEQRSRKFSDEEIIDIGNTTDDSDIKNENTDDSEDDEDDVEEKEMKKVKVEQQQNSDIEIGGEKLKIKETENMPIELSEEQKYEIAKICEDLKSEELKTETLPGIEEEENKIGGGISVKEDEDLKIEKIEESSDKNDNEKEIPVTAVDSAFTNDPLHSTDNDKKDGDDVITDNGDDVITDIPNPTEIAAAEANSNSSISGVIRHVLSKDDVIDDNDDLKIEMKKDEDSETVIDLSSETLEDDLNKFELIDLPESSELVINVDDETVDDDTTTKPTAEAVIELEQNVEKYFTQTLASLPNRSKADQLIKDLHKKQNSKQYLNILQQRQRLPAYQDREHLKREMFEVFTSASERVILICGETGSGKSTQIPQFILDESIERGRGDQTFIAVSQPRRICATSLAERVANERGESLGDSVGYQVRLDAKLPRNDGSIIYCTVGIILRWFMHDPLLSRVSHLILDEIHERECNSDFLLILTKQLLRQRQDLNIILMSATLDADKFAQFFRGARIIHIPGISFDVKEFFLDDILDIVTPVAYQKVSDSYVKQMKAVERNRPRLREDRGSNLEDIQKLEFYQRRIEFYNQEAVRNPELSFELLSRLLSYNEHKINFEFVLELVRILDRRGISYGDDCSGAILVFLPGWAEISKLNTMLRNDRELSRSCEVYPLHSLLPQQQQKAVFERPIRGRRKVILSTILAETSVTIEDVVYVIDSGKTKLSNFDLQLNTQTLTAELISKANAIQRRGRAGRVGPGECFHLFSKFTYTKIMAEYLQPEMLRMRLENLCLQVKLLKLGKCMPFLSQALDAPSLTSVQLALNELYFIGAIDADESLTALGYHLANLPVDIHCGKMMVYSTLFKCVDPVLTIAAIIDYRDPFVTPMGREKQVEEVKYRIANGAKSDHLMVYNAFWAWQQQLLCFGESAARQFADTTFLSHSTLLVILKLKKQLFHLLVQAGLLVNASGSGKIMTSLSSGHSFDEMLADADINRYSANQAVVTSVIAAGLFPNLAFTPVSKEEISKRKRGKFMRLIDPFHFEKQTIFALFHSKSVNRSYKTFETKLLVYYLKIKSSQCVNLYDSTMVSALALILFGDGFQFYPDSKSSSKKHTLVALGPGVTVRLNSEDMRVLMSLKTYFNILLTKKFSLLSSSSTSQKDKDVNNVLSNENRYVDYVARLLAEDDSFVS